MIPKQKTFIEPNDQESLRYWSQKIGCSTVKLRETILCTGLLDPVLIRRHLYSETFMYQPVKVTKRMISKTLDFLF